MTDNTQETEELNETEEAQEKFPYKADGLFYRNFLVDDNYSHPYPLITGINSLVKDVTRLKSETKKSIHVLNNSMLERVKLKELLCEASDRRQVHIRTFTEFSRSIFLNHGDSLFRTRTSKCNGYMPYILETPEDKMDIILEAIKFTPSFDLRYKAKSSSEQAKLIWSLFGFISEIKAQMISDAEIRNYAPDEDTALIYFAYQRRLMVNHLIDCDDLLLLASKLLMFFSRYRKLYRRCSGGIYVSNAQNLTKAQDYFLYALVNDNYENVVTIDTSDFSETQGIQT